MRVLCTLILLVYPTAAEDVTRKAGYCATYGDCGGLPCVSNQAAETLPAEKVEIVEEICPHLKGKYCCTADQVDIMQDKIGKADWLLSSCERAVTNFRSLICDLTCSQDQSLFLEVTEANERDDGSVQATRLSYYLSQDYSDKVWMSIRKTSKMICGNFWSQCSHDDLFSFIGDNHWTELKVDYKIAASPPTGFQHASDDHLVCVEDAEGVCNCS
jgi:hypothetical protein